VIPAAGSGEWKSQLQLCHAADFDASAGNQHCVRDLEFLGMFGVPKRASVVFERSYFARQVQVCVSLARATDDPALKLRYEALAVEFAQNIGSEVDLDMNAAPLASIDPKPGSGDTGPYK
jgi:hypothetical protein